MKKPEELPIQTALKSYRIEEEVKGDGSKQWFVLGICSTGWDDADWFRLDQAGGRAFDRPQEYVSYSEAQDAAIEFAKNLPVRSTILNVDVSLLSIRRLQDNG